MQLVVVLSKKSDLEWRKKTLKIHGSAGGMTATLYTNIYIATAVKTSEINRSLNCWFMCKNYYQWWPRQMWQKFIFHQIRNRRKFNKIASKKHDTESSRVSGQLSKSFPISEIPLHLYSLFDIEHHMILVPNC